MLYYFLIFVFIISHHFVTGQNSLSGEYVGHLLISNTDSTEIRLNLNCDKTFKINSASLQAYGKWHMVNSTTLKLKAAHTEIGCYVSKKKRTMKFQIGANKMIWKGNPKANHRRIERELTKSVGEKVTITSTEKAAQAVLFKIKQFNCDYL